VEPSPAPKVVPMIVNNALYVVRDTAAPFAFKKPLGMALAENHIIVPVGVALFAKNPKDVDMLFDKNTPMNSLHKIYAHIPTFLFFNIKVDHELY
jgi:hypothetical protein